MMRPTRPACSSSLATRTRVARIPARPARPLPLIRTPALRFQPLRSMASSAKPAGSPTPPKTPTPEELQAWFFDTSNAMKDWDGNTMTPKIAALSDYLLNSKFSLELFAISVQMARLEKEGKAAELAEARKRFDEVAKRSPAPHTPNWVDELWAQARQADARAQAARAKPKAEAPPAAAAAGGETPGEGEAAAAEAAPEPEQAADAGAEAGTAAPAEGQEAAPAEEQAPAEAAAPPAASKKQKGGKNAGKKEAAAPVADQAQ